MTRTASYRVPHLESDLQGDFSRFVKSKEGRFWLFEKFGINSYGFELKVARGCGGDTLMFSQIKEDQWEALLRASGERGTYWKMPDDSIGNKPFDCMLLVNAVGLAVIGFETTTARPGGAYAVRIGALDAERVRQGGRGSVSEAWCAEHGYQVPLSRH